VPARSYESADIKSGLAEGGKILGVFIVSRATLAGFAHVAYIRTDFARGFLPFTSYRDRRERIYKSLDSLVGLLRGEFGYSGEITLFLAGDKGLRRFRMLLPFERSLLDPELRAAVSRKPARQDGADESCR
jgi:hypothetical protein